MSPPAASGSVELFRFSELGLNPAGHRHLLLKTYGDPAELRRLMSSGDVVTASEVTELARSLGFTPSEREVEVQHIVQILNTIRVTKPKEEGFPEVQQLLDNVAKALKTVLDDVPPLIENQKTQLSHLDVNAIKGASESRLRQIRSDLIRRAEVIGGLALLLSAARKLQRDPFFIRPDRKPDARSRYHRDVVAVWFRFDVLARKHGKQISFTKEGSRGVLLLDKALKRVGIGVSPDSIAKELKRFKARSLREIDL
jgi:hypothetical protein